MRDLAKAMVKVKGVAQDQSGITPPVKPRRF